MTLKPHTASSANGYKHVWVVYDTDDFPADHINKTAQLCDEESSFMQSDLHRSTYCKC